MMGFDEKIILIESVNDQATGIQNGLVVSSESFERERKLYQDQIHILKEENAYLRNIIDRLAPPH